MEKDEEVKPAEQPKPAEKLNPATSSEEVPDEIDTNPSLWC